MRHILLAALLTATVVAQIFRYGVHEPEGTASVGYLYSESGTWKQLAKIEYLWNYYNWTDNPKNHPYDKQRLIAYSDGNNLTTCRDANKHLLLDYNHDGEIDVTEDAGWAFHEHNGRGVNNTKQGTPFSNFWFDDNDLALVLSQAYGKPAPSGLSNYTDFTRWSIMTGNMLNWKPYGNEGYLDLIALDGLYYIANKSKANAEKKFDVAATLAKATYNSTSLRYDYSIEENYKLGLLAVFSSFLYEYSQVATYLQHYVSLRSHLLSMVQRNPGNTSDIYSWMVFNNSNPGNLFNTETMALGSLGLSAGASAILEVVYLRADHVYIEDKLTWIRSARVNRSTPGYLVEKAGYQPQDANQNYTVEFILRTSNNATSSIIARLEVAETTGKSTNTRLIRQQDFQTGMWSVFRMDFITSKNKWDFNIYWTGVADLDACLIRIKKPLGTIAMEH